MQHSEAQRGVRQCGVRSLRETWMVVCPPQKNMVFVPDILVYGIYIVAVHV